MRNKTEKTKSKEEVKDNLKLTLWGVFQGLIVVVHYLPYSCFREIHLVLYFSPTIILFCLAMIDAIKFARMKDEYPKF